MPENPDRPMPPLLACVGCPESNCDGCPIKQTWDEFEADERHDRHVSWVRMASAFVAAVVVGLLCLIVWQTHQVVSNHNSDIAQTHALALQIARVQAERSGDAAAIKKDVAAVAAYAQTLEQLANSLHNSSVGYLTAICTATPGCVPPPTSP